MTILDAISIAFAVCALLAVWTIISKTVVSFAVFMIYVTLFVAGVGLIAYEGVPDGNIFWQSF